ncbi:3-phosphoshikimate 1-carboxyvinyltransferase [Clostridiales bacterium F-3ap]|uniref:3-phosphoshikimate 1-carboxyvinyltransferase n=1 Tax=Anaerotalea alkaliphila TaxID=2662126 RepID=A0A7X5KLZ0_9FIRM|nr:3-phosphoshikimate 1-carboxyvinyltransferase [Anaerotalea alkaliphila]
MNPIRSIRGILAVPGDKSISHRSVMFGSLANGKTRIRGFLNGADCLSTISCFHAMGIPVEFSSPTELTVFGKGLGGLQAPGKMLDVGNSGTTMRLLSGILAGQSFPSTMTGDASIRKRPMGRVIEPLTRMGANIRSLSGDNLAPLAIEPGVLHGITYHSPVASAQVKSSILLAGLYAQGATTVVEPYVSRNHTEILLRQFGASIAREGAAATLVPGSPLEGIAIEVPADISSAAFFLVAALIVPQGDVVLKNVGINPTRDGIIHVLKRMNGDIELLDVRETNGEAVADIRVRSSRLTGTVVEKGEIPRLIDEIPAIAVAAAFAEGTTTIRDAAELKVKESNRIDAMVAELGKMGADLYGTEDGMVIHGGAPLRGASVESHHDHRIAMSLAVAGLRADGPTTIANSGCISISYPGFFDDLERLARP